MCIERARLVTEYSLQHGLFRSEPISILDKARLYRWVLEQRQPVVRHRQGYTTEMQPFRIIDTSPFAGSTTSKFKGVPLYPEFLALSLWPELHSLPRRPRNPYQLSEADAATLNRDIFPHWLEHSIVEIARQRCHSDNLAQLGLHKHARRAEASFPARLLPGQQTQLHLSRHPRLLPGGGPGPASADRREFTRLTVEAPAGKTIAYVMVHDTGNFWLMDDLCTDPNKAVIPVPTRSIGSHGDRIDLVFVPDIDYGSAASIDTWLPNFIQDIQNQIDQRLVAAAPVTGHVDSFNFYYTRTQGDSTISPHTLPANLTRVAPFADAYVMLHTNTFGDWTNWGPPAVFGAEGAVGRSFIHEAGHGIFVLADEYDDAPACTTARFEPTPNPNVWDLEADCRADVTAEGWGNANDCWKFTTCTTDWWKFGTTAFIMQDGDWFANGWGQPASRRVQRRRSPSPSGRSTPQATR